MEYNEKIKWIVGEKTRKGKAMVIGIIGGGASGMAAALAASENENVQVVLLERQARVGRLYGLFH